jgi:hypothetical protein
MQVKINLFFVNINVTVFIFVLLISCDNAYYPEASILNTICRKKKTYKITCTGKTGECDDTIGLSCQGALVKTCL